MALIDGEFPESPVVNHLFRKHHCLLWRYATTRDPLSG